MRPMSGRFCLCVRRQGVAKGEPASIWDSDLRGRRPDLNALPARQPPRSARLPSGVSAETPPEAAWALAWGRMGGMADHSIIDPASDFCGKCGPRELLPLGPFRAAERFFAGPFTGLVTRRRVDSGLAFRKQERPRCWGTPAFKPQAVRRIQKCPANGGME